MSPQSSRYRWFVVGVFFFFMLLHQTDRLLIGPLKSQISEDFKINNTQFGLVITGALIVSTVLYPIWGYLYDRYARAKLLALASFIWGSTTWLSAIVRSFGGFVAKIRNANLTIDEVPLHDAGALANPFIAGGHELRHLLIRHDFFGNVTSGADYTTAFHTPPSSPFGLFVG